MMLNRMNWLGSRCCLKKPLKLEQTTLCFWPGGKAANPDALHPGKVREKSLGESKLSPWDFPLLSWARSPQTFRNPSAAGGTCLLTPTTLFRQLRVQGGHRPGAGLGARSPQRNSFASMTPNKLERKSGKARVRLPAHGSNGCNRIGAITFPPTGRGS